MCVCSTTTCLRSNVSLNRETGKGEKGERKLDWERVEDGKLLRFHSNKWILNVQAEGFYNRTVSMTFENVTMTIMVLSRVLAKRNSDNLSNRSLQFLYFVTNKQRVGIPFVVKTYTTVHGMFFSFKPLLIDTTTDSRASFLVNQKQYTNNNRSAWQHLSVNGFFSIAVGQ